MEIQKNKIKTHKIINHSSETKWRHKKKSNWGLTRLWGPCKTNAVTRCRS